MWFSQFKSFYKGKTLHIVKMFHKIKDRCRSYLARYDAWCKELGLTPEHKRSCCVYKADPASQDSVSKETLTSDSNFKA